MRLLSLIAVFALFYGCSTPPQKLPTGWWRGEILLQGQSLPFNFEVSETNGVYSAALKNVTERLALDDIRREGDTVIFAMHIFDTELRARLQGDSLVGYYIKNFETNYRLPFKAKAGQDYRFTQTAEAAPDFSGTFQVYFSNPDESTDAVGIFTQTAGSVSGTFLTPTGDYRYLEGSVDHGIMRLSTFDGHHAFLFTATLQGDSIHGDYWSGKGFHQQWKGRRNAQAKLPDPESLTYLKPGYEKIDFSFPGLDGKPVSPSDPRFAGKVLILQIFGTWCPNCMDETKFLTQWYAENHDRGVEVLGLAYERKNDFDYASGRVRKMKEKLGVAFDYVIAGTYDKQQASSTLPMLNQVLAFPTTIFIGKDGKVKHIRTGFEGPGTGEHFDEFKRQFNNRINELLSEKSGS
jgi:thiol-disulfide isomerase/thioredoxin